MTATVPQNAHEGVQPLVLWRRLTFPLSALSSHFQCNNVSDVNLPWKLGQQPPSRIYQRRSFCCRLAPLACFIQRMEIFNEHAQHKFININSRWTKMVQSGSSYFVCVQIKRNFLHFKTIFSEFAKIANAARLSFYLCWTANFPPFFGANSKIVDSAGRFLFVVRQFQKQSSTTYLASEEIDQTGKNTGWIGIKRKSEIQNKHTKHYGSSLRWTNKLLTTTTNEIHEHNHTNTHAVFIALTNAKIMRRLERTIFGCVEVLVRVRTARIKRCAIAKIAFDGMQTVVTKCFECSRDGREDNGDVVGSMVRTEYVVNSTTVAHI